MNRRCALLLAATLAFTLPACATTAGSPGTAPAPAQLAACTGGPHCVSSLGDDEHRVAAFKLTQPAESAWPAVVEAVRGSERTTIVQSDGHYLHAEVASPWHFYTDDLELMLGNDGHIDVRSSSRIGYYDFEVNRKRIEALRETLAAKGVVAR